VVKILNPNLGLVRVKISNQTSENMSTMMEIPWLVKLSKKKWNIVRKNDMRMYAELYPFAFNYNNNKNATGELIKNMRWLVQAQTHRTGHSEK